MFRVRKRVPGPATPRPKVILARVAEEVPLGGGAVLATGRRGPAVVVTIEGNREQRRRWTAAADATGVRWRVVETVGKDDIPSAYRLEAASASALDSVLESGHVRVIGWHWDVPVTVTRCGSGSGETSERHVRAVRDAKALRRGQDREAMRETARVIDRHHRDGRTTDGVRYVDGKPVRAAVPDQTPKGKLAELLARERAAARPALDAVVDAGRAALAELGDLARALGDREPTAAEAARVDELLARVQAADRVNRRPVGV